MRRERISRGYSLAATRAFRHTALREEDSPIANFFGERDVAVLAKGDVALCIDYGPTAICHCCVVVMKGELKEKSGVPIQGQKEEQGN